MTRWTDKTELFAEYPPLVVGETSRFAIHLTRLDPFKAVTEGTVEVRLRGGSASAGGLPRRRAVASGHLRRRRQADARGQARAGDRAAVHGTHRRASRGRGRRVSECRCRARGCRRAGEDAPGISFLKEQQWSLDFGTAVVQRAGACASRFACRRGSCAPGGAADVVAPIDGRLTRVAGRRARGARVARTGTRAPAAAARRCLATCRSCSARAPTRRRRSPWRRAIASVPSG